MYTNRSKVFHMKKFRSTELTFKTGLDFSASDLRSSIAAFCATEVRATGAGAKAAAEPAKREIRASFMVD